MSRVDRRVEPDGKRKRSVKRGLYDKVRDVEIASLKFGSRADLFGMRYHT